VSIISEWADHSSHKNLLLDIGAHIFMGAHHALGDPHLVPHLTVLSDRCQPLDPHVASNRTVPRDDGVADEGVVAHGGVRDDAAVRQSHASADLAVGTDGHVGSQLAVRPHCRALMHKDVAVLLLGKTVDFVVVQEGSLGLDVVRRLANIVPEVVPDGQRVKLAFLGHFGVDFGLNHAETLGDLVQNGSVKHIDSGIYVVSHKLFGLLNESVHFPGLLLVDDHPESGWVLHRGQQDAALLSVSPVKFKQLFKRVVANDVAVEDKEDALLVALLELLLCELDGARRSQRLLFLGVYELNSVLFLKRGEGLDQLGCLGVDGSHLLLRY
jgi:hypothetical protein